MLKGVLLNIDKSFDFINPGSDEYVPLAKFASLVTKDSHYFDTDNFPGKLFIAAIGYLYNINIDKAESKNEALMKVKIIRDEISNFTITYGLIAYDEKEEIKTTHNKVYVFENPTVFYELLRKTKNMKITLVCTSGQPNVSCLMLLDKLTELIVQMKTYCTAGYQELLIDYYHDSIRRK